MSLRKKLHSKANTERDWRCSRWWAVSRWARVLARTTRALCNLLRLLSKRIILALEAGNLKRSLASHYLRVYLQKRRQRLRRKKLRSNNLTKKTTISSSFLNSQEIQITLIQYQTSSNQSNKSPNLTFKILNSASLSIQVALVAPWKS